MASRDWHSDQKKGGEVSGGVNFNCTFTEGEIEVVLQALSSYVTSGLCPDGLKKDLMSVTQAFYQVQKNGAAL